MQKIISSTTSNISLSFDIWSSLAGHSYLGIKAHFITPEYEYKTYTLDFIYLSIKHTGQNIFEAIDSCLNRFQINNVASITCDNALRAKHEAQ
jgi:hypothetical protein